MKKSAPVATFRQDYFILFTINLKNYNNLYIIIHIRKWRRKKNPLERTVPNAYEEIKRKTDIYYNIYHHISVNEVCGLLMKYSYSSNPIFILKEGIKLILTRIKRKPDLN